MQALRIIDPKILFTLLIGWVVGSFFVAVMPLLSSNTKFLVLLPVGLLFFLYLVINPKGALVLILIIRPVLDAVMESTRLGGFQGIGIGSLFNIGVILVFLFLYFKNSTKIPAPKNFLLCWVIFLLVILPSVFYSPFVFRAIRLYLNHITYFSMAVLPFLLVKNRQDFLFWLKVLAISFILPVIVANVDMATGGRYYNPDSGNRVMGSFTHPNILAFFVLLGITVYFYIIRGQFYKIYSSVKYCLFAGMANMAALLVMAKTRSAWISALMIYFLYGWLKEKRILVYILLVCSLAALTPVVQDRVITMLGSGGSENYEGDDSWTWRLKAWASALPPIMLRPLHGYGLTSFKPLSHEFSQGGEDFGSHNLYLEMWFESGIFVLMSYLVLLFTTFSIFWEQMKNASDPITAKLSALLASYVLSYAIICSSDNLGYYLVFNWYFWFFIGLSMVGLKLKNA